MSGAPEKRNGADGLPLSLLNPIGSASLRRSLQLRALFPACAIEPVRGNVQTRLRKLDEGQYGALVLAAAGLKSSYLFSFHRAVKSITVTASDTDRQVVLYQ